MAKNPRNMVTTSTPRPGGAATATLRPPTTKAETTTTVKPTREQIAKRAHEIWVKNGCKHGQDEQNWFEAERQLKAEMSR